MPSSTRAQEQIAARMVAGQSLDRVEEEVIDHSEFNDHQKAALWLYAWSFVDSRVQRAWANRYVSLVEPG